MSFTGNYMCTSFKQEVLQAVHNFTTTTGDVFKFALYDNNASFTAATTSYTVTNETSGTAYVAGGKALTNITPTTSGTTGLADFVDLVWGTASFSARGGMIYNSTAGVNSVIILDFGSVKTATVGDFTIQFPAADASNAIIRIA
jgi:hypothetical protein